MAQPGDHVHVIASSGEYSGRYMPSKDEHIVVLKLDNGYNVGLSKDSITSIKVTSVYNKQERPLKTQKPKPGLGKISILHTGGTIASRVDYRTGGVVASFRPEELVEMFPELEEIANIDSRLIANMWSDDLRFKNLQLLAQAIDEEIEKGVEGIIVGMGTDNLAVASAAISFMIQQPPVPIIFVGSQRSSDRGSSDAAMNLICAANFITQSDYAGVALCMHHTSNDDVCAILPGAKSYKLHSSRRDAFKAINTSPIALVDYRSKKINFVKEDYLKKNKERKALVHTDMEEKVGLVKVHINMYPEVIRAFKGFKGLVIEGTGLGQTPGHVPNEDCAPNVEIFKAIKELCDSGCVVVMCTQTIYGRVQMNVYSKARDLLEMGVVSGEDMLATTAHVKLAWLLANKPEDTKTLVTQNLVGEIEERTLYE